MDDFTPLGAGLAGLPLLSGARTRSVSPENPTGEKGKGAMAVPVPDDPGTLPFSPAASDLGQGWKVSPFVKVAAGETKAIPCFGRVLKADRCEHRQEGRRVGH